MPLTAAQLADINNATYEVFLNKGKVLAQNIQQKPLLKLLDGAAGSFAGGRDSVALNVKAGQGGGSLQGYSGDDQLTFYNPTGIKRARYNWKEHHIGKQITHTELKENGIDVIDSDAGNDSTAVMSGRERHALANILDEKNEMMAEDYAVSLNDLLWGDGSSDAKALAGVQSLIFANPLAGTTGGLSRSIYAWWRNRAATAAHAAAGGQGAITSSTANGGALIEFLDTEERQRTRYKTPGSRIVRLCGSDFIDAYKRELRANGYYTQTGWSASGAPDGSMKDPKHDSIPLQYDPTLDDLGLAKRCYTLDIGRNGIRLLYMDGQRRKKHNPARPYDRLVMYNGVTTTAVLCAKQLNTSGVYDIA